MKWVFFLGCCCLFLIALDARVLPGWTVDETAVMTTKFYAMFSFYDINKDGNISESDFVAVIDNLKAMTGIDAEIKNKLNTMMGLLWKEHFKVTNDRIAFPISQLVEEAFNMLENREIYYAIVKARTGWFYILDVNADGLINLPEFLEEANGIQSGSDVIARLTKAFAVIDADGDGNITACEYVSAYVLYVSDPKISYNALPLF